MSIDVRRCVIGIEIVPVTSRKERKIFVKVPWTVYGDDPNWVPPLIIDRMGFLDPGKNSFFKHSEAQLFTAYRNGKPAGRISAHTNMKHCEFHKENTGFFGFFECIDDAETSTALFSAAIDWLQKRDVDKVRGPASFTINDEYGLLVEGFDTPPIIIPPFPSKGS